MLSRNMRLRRHVSRASRKRSRTQASTLPRTHWSYTSMYVGRVHPVKHITVVIYEAVSWMQKIYFTNWANAPVAAAARVRRGAGGADVDVPASASASFCLRKSK